MSLIYTKLAEVKGHQNWVKVSGEYIEFPGGGTQFIHGALHYNDFIQEYLPDIAWGKRSRVVLDVGCGVASFGGYLFERDVLTMSFGPKDEHEAQVQFSLERGIPAISIVMGTKRLPFPSKVFDVIHCARCRVPWHIEKVVLSTLVFTAFELPPNGAVGTKILQFLFKSRSNLMHDLLKHGRSCFHLSDGSFRHS